MWCQLIYILGSWLQRLSENNVFWCCSTTTPNLRARFGQEVLGCALPTPPPPPFVLPSLFKSPRWRAANKMGTVEALGTWVGATGWKPSTRSGWQSQRRTLRTWLPTKPQITGINSMTSYKRCVCLRLLSAEACCCLKGETVDFSCGILLLLLLFFWFHSKAKQFVPATSFWRSLLKEMAPGWVLTTH